MSRYHYPARKLKKKKQRDAQKYWFLKQLPEVRRRLGEIRRALPGLGARLLQVGRLLRDYARQRAIRAAVPDRFDACKRWALKQLPVVRRRLDEIRTVMLPWLGTRLLRFGRVLRDYARQLAIQAAIPDRFDACKRWALKQLPVVLRRLDEIRTVMLPWLGTRLLRFGRVLRGYARQLAIWAAIPDRLDACKLWVLARLPEVRQRLDEIRTVMLPWLGTRLLRFGRVLRGYARQLAVRAAIPDRLDACKCWALKQLPVVRRRLVEIRTVVLPWLGTTLLRLGRLLRDNARQLAIRAAIPDRFDACKRWFLARLPEVRRRLGEIRTVVLPWLGTTLLRLGRLVRGYAQQQAIKAAIPDRFDACKCWFLARLPEVRQRLVEIRTVLLPELGARLLRFGRLVRCHAQQLAIRAAFPDRLDSVKRWFLARRSEVRQRVDKIRGQAPQPGEALPRSGRLWHGHIRPVVRALAAVVLIALGLMANAGWQAIRPTYLKVTVLSDVAFRLRHPDWASLLETRFRAMDQIYRKAGTRVRWHLLEVGRLDPTGNVNGLDNRGVEIPRRMASPADVLVSVTGVAEPQQTGSTAPFGRVAMVADFPNETEAQNALIMAHEVAHLFGVPNDPAGSTIMAAMPRTPEFSGRAIAAVRAARTYHFGAGAEGLLEGSWNKRAAEIIAGADTGPKALIRAHQVLATALSNQFHWEAAIGHLREAVRLDPRDASTHHNLGMALALAGGGQEDQALAELREAVHLDPGDARIHQALGALLVRMRMIEESVAEFKEAIRLDPSNATTEAMFGVALSMQQDHTGDAMTAFHEALRLNPQMELSNAALQQSTTARIRTLEDLAEQRRRVQRAPDDAEAHYELGLVEWRMGHLSEAIQAMQKAVELRPAYGKAHSELATFYYTHGESGPAWAEVKKARALGTEPPEDLLSRLEKQTPMLR